MSYLVRSKKGPARYPKSSKMMKNHKNKHKRCYLNPVSNSSLDSRGMCGMAQRISTTQIVMFTLLLLVRVGTQARYIYSSAQTKSITRKKCCTSMMILVSIYVSIYVCIYQVCFICRIIYTHTKR